MLNLFMFIPTDEAGREARNKAVRAGFAGRFGGLARRFRDNLHELYGQERGDAVKSAEAFEICEYGSQPTDEQIRRLFPFLAQNRLG